MNSRTLAQHGSFTEVPAEWTLIDLFSVFARRRGWVFGALAIACGAACLYWICATPRYRATSIIEVQKESTGAFGLDNTTADRQTTAVSDSFDDNLTLQTEVGILQSDAVTLDVIHRTGLENTSDYFAPHTGAGAFIHRLRFWQKPLEPLSAPIAEAPNRRFVALKIFAAQRKVATQAGTRLIVVSYSDPDPHRAAAVANGLVQALSDYRFESRSAAAAQSASWLSAQLAGLREQTDALDARAAALDRASGDYGDDGSHNPVLERLDTLNAALSTAESNRIVREAIWRAVQTGNPEAISGLAGNPNAGPNTQNSLALLQTLRSQESGLKSQMAESAKRYGENWPAFTEQRAQLASVQNSIQEELRRLGDRAHTDYQVAFDAESAARDAFTQQKELASQLTGNAVALRLARQEAGQSRALYSSLLGQLQQTGVLEGLHSGNFAVVSPALVPPSDHPSSPSLPLLAAGALGLGALAGCGAAVTRELLDTAVQSATDLDTVPDAPVFAEIPAYRLADPWYRRLLPQPVTPQARAESGGDEPVPESPFLEGLHRLRASLLLSHSSRSPQVITITRTHHASARRKASDGVPSLALSLATVLAQAGSPVLFVDADLRSAPDCGSAAKGGLSEILSRDDNGAVPVPVGGLPSLSVLHSGSRPPCPSELIASSRMADLLARWRDAFTFIVIHAPAVVHADALVLAQLSDAVLASAWAGETRRGEILPALQALSRQVPDHAVLGVVLENAPSGSAHART